MRIHVLTVCVDYSDHLSLSLERWCSADTIIVVTSPTDTDTHALCSRYGTLQHRTKAFWDNGAKFNKGASIAEAYRIWMPKEENDWALFVDADVIPPTDWRVRVEMSEVKQGNIYGAPRHGENGMRIADPYPAGYFLLFHTRDQNAHDPIVDTHWYHAGNYDSTFISRWARPQLHWLPIPLRHTSPTGQNWCGRGNIKAMNELICERRRRGGQWRHETIS